MKKLNFSQTELIADIRRQFTNNSNALNSGIPARNLPVLTFKQPVEDIQTAMEIFQHCLEYEQLSIQKIERVQGEDDIPSKLYLTIIDSQTILAIGNNGLYVLDQRIYKIGKKSRHCIAEIKKIFDGQTLAVYK